MEAGMAAATFEQVLANHASSADIASRIAFNFTGLPAPSVPAVHVSATHVTNVEASEAVEPMPVMHFPMNVMTPAGAEEVTAVVATEQVREAPPNVLEGVQLHMSTRNATGYKNVYATGGEFVCNHWCGGRTEHIGYYPTAADAALAYARHVLRKNAQQQAEANGEALPDEPPPKKVPRTVPMDLQTEYEGVQLILSDRSATGYKCVYKNGTGFSVDIGVGDGKMQHIGSYRTVLEGAVAYARYQMQHDSLPVQSTQAMTSWQQTWTPDVLAKHEETRATSIELLRSTDPIVSSVALDATPAEVDVDPNEVHGVTAVQLPVAPPDDYHYYATYPP